MPRGPTPATSLSFSQPALIISWVVQLTEEEKTWACFADDSMHIGTAQKWTRIALQPFSGTSLKDTDERKSSQWAEFEQCAYILKEKKKIIFQKILKFYLLSYQI